MTTFTVHVPRDPVEPQLLAERVRFVADGFSWAAFIFGPLWLLWNRLWLALALWIGAAGLAWAFAIPWFSPAALLGLLLLIEYLLGLEGNALLASILRRRGLVPTDVVAANGAEGAERIWFRRAPQMQKASRAAAMPVPGGNPEDEEFVGLFPGAGG